jgi:hypothetical protein
MFYQGLAAAVAVAIAVTMYSVPVDARAKAQKRYDVQTPRDGRVAGQTPSLDGRVTGRPRTCGFDTFQYDGFGVPYGPYCH